MSDGENFVEAIGRAREQRSRRYTAGLLWKAGTYPGRYVSRGTDPAPWPLIGERATAAERKLGVPAGTFCGSDHA